MAINYNVPRNSRGQNANIKGHVVDDEIMKQHGFHYDAKYEQWDYVQCLYDEITLYIHISEGDEDNVVIDVIDDDFCQPYDYQSYLGNKPDARVPIIVHRQVQSKMKELMKAGIVTGYTLEDYV